MAKKGSSEKGGSYSKDGKVADIIIASTSLAEEKDHSHGYDETMQHHINCGKGKMHTMGGKS